MAELSANPPDRNFRAVRSLMGLAIGDGFGQGFFVSPGRAEAMFAGRALPAGQWMYTDDTMMTLSGWRCCMSAGEYGDNLGEALWATVSALGDRDTTCAIVGGMVAAHTGVEDLPPEWIEAREPLPMWVWEGLGDSR